MNLEPYNEELIEFIKKNSIPDKIPWHMQGKNIIGYHYHKPSVKLGKIKGSKKNEKGRLVFDREKGTKLSGRIYMFFHWEQWVERVVKHYGCGTKDSAIAIRLMEPKEVKSCEDCYRMQLIIFWNWNQFLIYHLEHNEEAGIMMYEEWKSKYQIYETKVQPLEDLKRLAKGEISIGKYNQIQLKL